MVALTRRCGVYAAKAASYREELSNLLFVRLTEQDAHKKKSCRCADEVAAELNRQGIKAKVTVTLPEVEKARDNFTYLGRLAMPDTALPPLPNPAEETAYVQKVKDDKGVRGAGVRVHGAHTAEERVRTKLESIDPGLFVEDDVLAQAATETGSPHPSMDTT
jgi:hypothetical protein